MIVFSVVFSFIEFISYAEIDMHHNYKENLKLLDTNWYVGHCRNGKKTCIKNLIRYESAVELEEFLIDLEKSAEDEKEEAFWTNLAEKIGIGAVLGAGFYFYPWKLTVAGIAAYVLDSAVNSVKSPIKLIKCLFKKSSDENKGLLEDIREKIFGDKYVVILTKDQKKAFVNKIREKFHQLIKNKEWLNNDIIVLSVDIDPKVMQSYIKFDRVNFDLNYKKDLKNYFKKIKV